MQRSEAEFRIYEIKFFSNLTQDDKFAKCYKLHN